VNLEGQTLGIYEVGAELGRGGMGAVYRAKSTKAGPAGPAGCAVALKVFHAELVEDARSLERFRREADVGKSIRHDHVVRTFDHGEQEIDDKTFYFMVMEVIEGQTLDDLLKELGTYPDALLFQVADQVLDALDAIHERGIVHRDIKPENIVITPDHRVLLMDLGVARLLARGETLTQAGEFVGSLPYASPEQFGAEEGIGPLSDLYSFGIVLYELATGRNPFDVNELGNLLAQKLQGEIGRAKAENADVDSFWDEVIFTCTQRQIGRRFGSAAELRTILRDGERSEWWRAITAGRVLPGAERALKRLRLVREAPLIARDGELELLRAVYRTAMDGEGRIQFVSGPGGAGKSRLVFNFIEEMSSASGPLVLAGRCAGPGGRAYQPFLEVVHDLLGIDEMEIEGRRGRLEEELHRLLPDTPAVVPHLAEFLLAGLNPGEEGGFSQDALLSSFTNILRRTSEERPIVVVVEDLHLAGGDTLGLFGYLARCLPGHKILLVGVYEEDEVGEESELAQLLSTLGQRDDTDTLTLLPFTRAAADELLLSICRSESTVRALGAPVHEKSDGNPHIMLELIAHLKSSGALVADGDRLMLQGDPEAIELPSSVTDLIALKLRRLDEEQRETLEAAAVMGGEFEASLLAAVLEERRIKLLKRLAILERKYRLIESSGKDSFRFAKRQIQEAIYQGISPGLREEYHSIVADAIEEKFEEAEEDEASLPPRFSFAFVYHLQNAGRALEGEPRLGEALDYLQGNYHSSFSVPFLEGLAGSFGKGEMLSRFSIATHLWLCYELQARTKDQQRVLEEAQGFADTIGDAAKQGEVHTRAAVTYWRSGDQARAVQEAERGLELARDAGDRFWQGNALHALGAAAYARGDHEECGKCWREALEIRREIGDKRGEARSLQALGAVVWHLGATVEEIFRMRREALDIFREIGDRRGETLQLNNIGNSLAFEQKHAEALDHFQRAARLSRELGDLQSEAYPLCNGARSQLTLGRLDEARSSFERALELFRQVGNRDLETSVLTDLVGLMVNVGEYGDAQGYAEVGVRICEETGVKHRLAAMLREAGLLLHARGDRAEAWETFERAWAIEDEIQQPDSFAFLLIAMGGAALREESVSRACELLEQGVEVGATSQIVQTSQALAQSRLARAYALAGRDEDGAARVAEARELLTEQDAPETLFHLGMVADDPELIRKAHMRLRAQSRSIRNDSHREHFLQSKWPHGLIEDEAARLDESSG